MLKSKKLLPVVVALALMGLAGSGLHSAGAVPNVPADEFLKISGIPGETTNESHVGEIEIESWSFAESSNQANQNGAGGGGAGKVSMQDFHFTARYSKASPLLFLAVATGQHYPSAQLTLEKSNEGEATAFLKVTLTDIVITSYETEGAGDVPLDSFTIGFSKIAWDYTGPGGEHTMASWDLAKGKKQ